MRRNAGEGAVLSRSLRSNQNYPLTNPYDLPVPPIGDARAWSSSVLVAATAAGLTLLAGGVAAAEPVQDDESGLALGSFDLDAPTPSGSGRLMDDGPDALPEPFPIEPGPDVDYELAHDVSITPFRLIEPVLDKPAASPARLLPEPTDGLDSVLPVGDAAVGIVPVRGGAIENPQPPDAHVVVPDPPGRIGGDRADRPLPPEPTVPVPLLSDRRPATATVPNEAASTEDPARSPVFSASAELGSVPLLPGSQTRGLPSETTDGHQADDTAGTTAVDGGQSGTQAVPVWPGEPVDSSGLTGAQATMVESLQGEQSDEVADLFSTTYVVETPKDRNGVLADVGNQLRRLVLDSPDGMCSAEVQCYVGFYPDAEQQLTVARPFGLSVGDETSSGRGQLRQLTPQTVQGADEVVQLHTHPVYPIEHAGEIRVLPTVGVSAADGRFVSGMGGYLGALGSDARVRVRSVDLLTGQHTEVSEPDPSTHGVTASPPGIPLDPRPSGAATGGPLTVRVAPGPSGMLADRTSVLGIDTSTDVLLGDDRGDVAVEADGTTRSRDAASRLRLDEEFLRSERESFIAGVLFDRELWQGDGDDTIGWFVADDGTITVLDSSTGLPSPSHGAAPGGATSTTVPAADAPPEQVGGSGGGVVVGGEPVRRPSLEEVRRMLFPGGDPLLGDPGAMEDLVGARPPRDGLDGSEFDPNRVTRDAPAVLPSPDQEQFPSNPELENLLWPSGVPGLFPGTPVTERDRLPGNPTPTAPSGEPVVQPGSTRVGADGQVQTLITSQVLEGDGRAGTVPGRVDFFRGDDGRVEAVTTSPRRTEDDGTEWVWIPNLGTSLSSNLAGRVTTVQSVATPQYPSGTSAQAVRIRTGDSTQRLAGGGSGSQAGSLTYRVVPGSPRLQDVLVEPSTSEVVHADGSSTLVRTARVPANRQWNASGAPERFQVEVGTEMVPVSRQVFVPAPAPVVAPVYSDAPAPAFPEEPVPTRAAGGARVVPSPALTTPSRRPVSRPAAPAAVAQPQPEPEPTWQDRAGRVGEVLWNVLTYPHPLSPRGALGPVIWGPAAAERQLSY